MGDMTVVVGGLRLKNPVIAASGTFGVTTVQSLRSGRRTLRGSPSISLSPLPAHTTGSRTTLSRDSRRSSRDIAEETDALPTRPILTNLIGASEDTARICLTTASGSRTRGGWVCPPEFWKVSVVTTDRPKKPWAPIVLTSFCSPAPPDGSNPAMASIDLSISSQLLAPIRQVWVAALTSTKTSSPIMHPSSSTTGL